MADSLNDILVKVSSKVSQTVSVTNTSDEYGLWRSFANMAQREWAESYDWQSLYKEYNTMTSNPSGNATIALPSDFRKLSGYPKITADGTNTYEYTEIDPQKKTQYGASDKYCYVLANPGQSYVIVNPGTLASGASIFISYWKSPASLASPADIIDCPNPEFLVQRTIAHVWEAREDGRYMQAKAEADRILSNLLEMENAKGYAYNSSVQTVEQSKYGFRIGRN